MSDDKRLERMEDKIDGLNTHLSSIDATLAAQHASLAEHIRRTSILEEEMKPVKEHVSMVTGVMKFIGLLTGLGALFELAKKLF